MCKVGSAGNLCCSKFCRNRVRQHIPRPARKVEVTVIDPPKQREDVTAFFSNHTGVYRYRPFVSRAMLWMGIVFLIGFPIIAYELFSGGQISTYETVKASVILVLAPYLIWSYFVVARKFKEVRIDGEGIKILPFGLHISPHEIEEIRHSMNFSGAGKIKLKLKSPHLMFHILAWSLGRTVTIPFNNRLLMPVAASA